MASVCCPSEEFIIASASLCSWQVGVHTLHFKHNNSLSGELFWEQVNLHTNNKKGNCIHHWDTGKQKETKLIKGAEQSCSVACFWLWWYRRYDNKAYTHVRQAEFSQYLHPLSTFTVSVPSSSQYWPWLEMDFCVLLKGIRAMVFYFAPAPVTKEGLYSKCVLFSLLLFPYSFRQGDSFYNSNK